MQSIKAKFVCETVEPIGDTEQVTMRAVYGGSDENKSFAAATPSASVSINISNPGAKGFFQPGKEYFGDFTEALAAPAAEPEAFPASENGLVADA